MRRLIIITILLFTLSAVKAQILQPVKWAYAAKKLSNNEALIFIKATLDEGWHIYSINQKDGGPQKTTITFTPTKTYELIGSVTEPKPTTKYEEVFKMDVSYFENSATFQQKIRLKAGQTTVRAKVEFMVCTNQKCLPPDEVNLTFPVK